MSDVSKLFLMALRKCVGEALRAAAVAAGVVASLTFSFVQAVGAEAVPYCVQLRELNNYAMSNQRFVPIIGQPRSGDYRETSLPLTGWTNCAFYGTTTYTCDSPRVQIA
jgi:hypothetical protein